MAHLQLEDLEAWVEAKKLCVGVYLLTKSIPNEEKYNIIKHLKESSRGVMGNIAEGFGRYYYKESMQFYYIAKGCLLEVRSDLNLCGELSYVNRKILDKYIGQIDIVHAKINGLIYTTRQKVSKK